jgi:hypothetical protein
VSNHIDILSLSCSMYMHSRYNSSNRQHTLYTILHVFTTILRIYDDFTTRRVPELASYEQTSLRSSLSQSQRHRGHKTWREINDEQCEEEESLLRHHTHTMYIYLVSMYVCTCMYVHVCMCELLCTTPRVVRTQTNKQSERN